jgi:hypothetical protein
MKLRLGPMPDTSVVKLTVSIPAPLKAQLDRYAQVHSQAFGATADAQTLIPTFSTHGYSRTASSKECSELAADSPGIATLPLEREMKDVAITVTLSDAQAWSFAQFLKRVCFSDYEHRATSEDEAYKMLDAGEKIREALREQGFAPR